MKYDIHRSALLPTKARRQLEMTLLRLKKNEQKSLIQRDPNK